jgi:hypothetical protein
VPGDLAEQTLHRDQAAQDPGCQPDRLNLAVLDD